MTMRPMLTLALLLGSMPLISEVSSCGSTGDVRDVVTDGGSYYVSYTPNPDPLPVQELFGLEVTVSSAQDHTDLIEDSSVKVDAWMPSMGHGMSVVPKVVANGDGTFTISNMEFSMTGDWEILVDVTRNGATEQAVFPVNCCQ